MTNGTLLRYLVAALVIAITVVVVRAMLTKRKRPRPARQPSSPSPTPAPIVLSAEALAVLRLVAARPGESVSFQQVRELLGTSPRNRRRSSMNCGGPGSSTGSARARRLAGTDM